MLLDKSLPHRHDHERVPMQQSDGYNEAKSEIIQVKN